jgi:hypothetical protein
MRKTKEVLRLRFELGLGQRQIARSCGMGLGTVHDYLERAAAAGFMANTQTLISQAYSAFNCRNLDNALALMSENVSWPKASEGGRVVGKEEIRSYWTPQWKGLILTWNHLR